MLNSPCAPEHTARPEQPTSDDTTTTRAEADLVVLLDSDRRPVGTAPREGVHGFDTPLHLAYSCWLFCPGGRFLLTRRALGKRSWPGVWTNSFCGHPRPGETVAEAVVRGGRHELGVDVEAVSPLLPDFAYRAVDASGVVENEVCPVHLARTTTPPVPHPSEVSEHVWVEIDELRAALAAAPWALSPWLREQAEQLDHRAWDLIRDYATNDDQGVAR
ncbi:isopentenyl-diphosphate Delta-isomerase [Nocardioides daphniae]|uniref:Isopentenyl-diphosphate Delta-isomerase n=1 Tax=Nocardioides daphniae TaxID=402297 RepID=A0ABQ1QLC1_9ACTN|nr:isopentenyl-diphosphate Delta-isomerase [Nocardioides daphniae]GGD30608.1 isopentenyl-diphosphate Delta-isomerase [Nocardioides daphniae]